MNKRIMVFLSNHALKGSMRPQLLALLAAVFASWFIPTSQAQPPAQVNKYLSLIAKPQRAVYRALGKPSRSDNVGGDMVSEYWKTKHIEVRWRSGKMFFLDVPAPAPTWQAALKKYGLSSAGVKMRQEDSDGDLRLFVLTGVKGIPAGWTGCAWYKQGGFQFTPRDQFADQ